MKNQTSRYHYSLFHLTWPVFLEMVLQIMAGSVDQLMMSQFSQVGVTAIGNANQIITFVLLLFNIVSSAALILISQYLGAGKEKKAVQFYSLSLFLNGSASFLLSVLFILAARPLFTAMRVPGEALSDCILYFRIIAVSFFVQALFVTFSAILKAHAFMKESMAVSVVMNLLNILGNWLLIPSMGVAGVALSSTASRMAGLGFLIFFFVKRLHTPVGLSILKTVGLKELRQLLSIGLPTGGEGLSYNLSQMGILIIVNSLGTYAVNTKIYVGILANISCLFAVSISQAVQVIVGHAAGAQDYDYARQRVRSCLGSFVCHVSAALCIEWSDLFDLYGLPGDSGTGKADYAGRDCAGVRKGGQQCDDPQPSGVGGCKIPHLFSDHLPVERGFWLKLPVRLRIWLGTDRCVACNGGR